MMYQKLLMGERPYSVESGKFVSFEEHRHPEIEIVYCIEGSYNIKVNKVMHKLEKGRLAVIGPMASHEFFDNGDDSRHALIIVVGPVLLADYFEPLTKKEISTPILNLNTKKNAELRKVVDDTVELIKSQMSFFELHIKGNIFRICGYILDNIANMNNATVTARAIRSVENVEKAIDLIHSRFNEELTVSEAAELCGYSNSNFCKTFKSITGDTFHNVLNEHRIKNACILLRETVHSIESIALQVGFVDSKSFCRVFKKYKGKSPGSYRNEKNKKQK